MTHKVKQKEATHDGTEIQYKYPSSLSLLSLQLFVTAIVPFTSQPDYRIQDSNYKLVQKHAVFFIVIQKTQ